MIGRYSMNDLRQTTANQLQFEMVCWVSDIKVMQWLIKNRKYMMKPSSILNVIMQQYIERDADLLNIVDMLTMQNYKQPKHCLPDMHIPRLLSEWNNDISIQFNETMHFLIDTINNVVDNWKLGVFYTMILCEWYIFNKIHLPSFWYDEMDTFLSTTPIPVIKDLYTNTIPWYNTSRRNND